MGNGFACLNDLHKFLLAKDTKKEKSLEGRCFFMQGTWVCLIPFLLVIPISMWTKQVQPGLFVGLLVGSYLMYPNILGGVEHMIHYLVKNIVVTNNIRIILFLYAFAGLVGMIKFTGGIKGFVHIISNKVKTKKSALLLTWVSTLGTFSEPDFRIVTIGSVMKAMINRLNMSKKQVGYAIEFTANPVIALIPIATAFVGYMVSVIGQAMKAANVSGTPYIMYVKSIPFNFFSIVIVLVGIYFSFIKKTNPDSELEKMAGDGENRKAGLQPAFNTEMGSEMSVANEGAISNQTSDSKNPMEQLTKVQAHLTQAEIDLTEAETSLKQSQQNDLRSNEISGNAPSIQDKHIQNANQVGLGSYPDPGDSPEAATTPTTDSSLVDKGLNMEMATEGTMDIHGDTTGVFERNDAQKEEQQDLKKQGQGATPPHADQQEDLMEAHRAYKKETPARPLNLIIPIALFLSLTLFLSWWDGHAKAKGFFNAFIKSDMLLVMLTSLLTAIIVALAFFMFQRFSAAQLATHFIKGGNELINVIVMLSLIWALTAVSEDLGFSHYISGHVKGWIPHMFIAPSLFTLGVIISYFIGSSWGTWGLLMPLGVTLAAESHTSVLLAIGAVFASGTFGAFVSPLSDNTVTTCTVLDMPVIKYARSKLTPALIAAGISVILFGVFSFIMR